jgi:TM2 domain-containing membrane protein YozV
MNSKQTSKASGEVSPKNRLTALLLAGILDTFGVHRFYVGKICSGIAILVAHLVLMIMAIITALHLSMTVIKLLTSEAFQPHLHDIYLKASGTDFGNVHHTLSFIKLLLKTPVADLHMYHKMLYFLLLALLALVLFVLVDFVKIALGKFADAEHKLIKKW